MEKLKLVVAAGVTFLVTTGIVDVGQGDALNGVFDALVVGLAAFHINIGSKPSES